MYKGKGIMEGSTSRKGNKTEEGGNAERVTEQSSQDKQKRSTEWYDEVGANSRVARACSTWKSSNGRNKPEWIVEMRRQGGSGTRRGSEGYSPFLPQPQKVRTQRNFGRTILRFMGNTGELVSFPLCSYACVYVYSRNRNNTRFIMSLSGIMGAAIALPQGGTTLSCLKFGVSLNFFARWEKFRSRI